MEWSQISSNWPALASAVLTRWPSADEDTVLGLDGDRNAFVAYVSRLEALPEAEAEERVAEWAQTAMPADAQMDPRNDNAAIAGSAAEMPPGEEPLDADEAFGDKSAPEQPIGRTG